MRRAQTFAVAAFMFTAWSGSAKAEDMTLADCDRPGGTLRFEAFQTSRMASAGIGPMDRRFVHTLVDQRANEDRLAGRPPRTFGDLVVEASAACTSPSEEMEDECGGGLYGKLSSMFSQTDEFANRGQTPRVQDGFVVERSVPSDLTPTQRIERVRLVLSGVVEWLTIRCPTNIPSPRTPVAQRENLFSHLIEHLVVGQSEDDVAKEKMGDREFATVSFTDDRAAETETTEIALFLGWNFGMQLAQDGDLRYRFAPFISLEKTSIEQEAPDPDETDDLTFGLSAPMEHDGPWGTHYITPMIKWESDTDFDSSVTSFRVDWSPFVPEEGCFEEYLSTNFQLRCYYAIVVDYVDVGDAGEKENLLELDQYTRAGIDLGLNYYHDVGEGPSQINLGLIYQRRESLNDEGGDADLFSAVLQFLPGASSHFSFGIEYNHGEDLSSLDEQETTMVRFGYRR